MVDPSASAVVVLPAPLPAVSAPACRAPAVLHRNELEKAQEDQILIGLGVKDRETACAERGLDWKQVQANNDEYDQKQQEKMPQPVPGQPGQKPPGGAPGEPPLPKPKGPPSSKSGE